MSDVVGAGSITRSAVLARRATTVVFVLHGLLFASWTAHIPHVKHALGLTNAGLGLSLFGAPIGSIVAMLFTGPLLTRFGSKRMVQATLVGYCATGVGVGLANSQLTLLLALLVWGFFQGSLDVSMNTQAVIVERAAGRPIMSGFHGAWSLGGFVGAGIGALGVGLGVSLARQLVALALVTAIVAGWSTRSLLPGAEHQPARSTARKALNVWVQPAVLILGGIALACMFCEGAAADWSAVYLHDSLGSRPAVAGLGYAAFAATMVTVRLAGDWLSARVRPHVLLPILAGTCTIVLATCLLIGAPVAALIGFGALGLGIGLIIPTIFTAAGRIPGLNTGSAVAAVAAVGWLGFVGGPPLIGILSQHLNLPVTLGLLPVATGLIAFVTRRSSTLRNDDYIALTREEQRAPWHRSS